MTISTCKKEETQPPGSNQEEWLIPVDQVLSGGPGPDGIPSVDNPQFAKASDVNFFRRLRFSVRIKNRR